MDRNSNNTELKNKQQEIINEYVELHGLDASQISFEDDNLTPIFDSEAVNILSLRLTDIQDIKPTRVEENGSQITVYCSVTLPDGRTRGAFGSCEIGEVLYDNVTASTKKIAEATATSRAFRRGIRNVGINLVRAHEDFKRTGQPSSAHTNNDPRLPIYQEINTIAYKIGMKKKTDIGGKMIENRSEYEMTLAEHFDGRTSAKELNDLELQKWVALMRTFERLNKAKPIAA